MMVSSHRTMHDCTLLFFTSTFKISLTSKTDSSVSLTWKYSKIICAICHPVGNRCLFFCSLFLHENSPHTSIPSVQSDYLHTKIFHPEIHVSSPELSEIKPSFGLEFFGFLVLRSCLSPLCLTPPLELQIFVGVSENLED